LVGIIGYLKKQAGIELRVINQPRLTATPNSKAVASLNQMRCRARADGDKA
jgi:hypothetical protein